MYLRDMSTLPHLVSTDAVTALRQLCEQYPEQVVFTTSLGLEDQALTDLIAQHDLPVRLVTLDTGRLFPETYDLIDRTRSKYSNLDLVSFFPDTASLEEFVNAQGMSSIFGALTPERRCRIRKIDPLKRALEGAAVWVTGLRAAQSDNRASLPRLERDGMTGLIKFNPLLDWTDAELDTYINSHGVPTNTLHRKGFPSIGCAPCTRAVLEGEHPVPAVGGGSSPPRSADCTRGEADSDRTCLCHLFFVQYLKVMKFDPTSPERKPRGGILGVLGSHDWKPLTVLAQPPSISGPESTCVEAAPFALATAPAGGC